jgi:hypothetical protein
VVDRAGLGLGEGRADASALLAKLREALDDVDGTARDVDIRLDRDRLRLTSERPPDRLGRLVDRRRIDPANDDERFLAAADAAVTAARRSDAGLVATVETAATAALLAKTLAATSSTSAEGRRFCTAWGGDPVFEGSALPAGPFIHQFPLRTAVGTVSLSEVPGDEVTAVGHRPEFDADRRLWFCDLQVEVGAAYTPFVELRLARYQPHSIAGVHLSATVRTDFVQVLPRREATFVVAGDARAAVVTLRGAVGVPRHAIALPDVASEVAASRVVETWVERLPAAATSDLEWEVASEVVALPVRMGLGAARSGRYDDVEWAGALPLPERQGGDRLRIRLAEYELHEADPKDLPRLTAVLGLRARRLVYSDEVEVP